MNTLPKVYLAGGLVSNWRESIMEEFGHAFEFFNPQDHGLENCSKQYTKWDLFFVKQSDIVFAFMEKDNKSGFGLTLELGYAKALDKLIILVDEKSAFDAAFERNFRIVKESASVSFTQLTEGLAYLRSFQPKHKSHYVMSHERV